MTSRKQALIAWTITGLALLGLVMPPVIAQTNVANAAIDLAGKILMVADSSIPRTVTNLFTFDRGAAVPFAIGASSLKVTNLDADKLDGVDGASYATRTGTETLTNKTLTTPTLTSPVLAGTPTGTWTNPTLVGVTNTGLADFSGASAGQIKFPSTQNASSDVNTFDDYKEGTFTPTVVGSTSGAATYTTQVGNYVKTGKRICFSLYVNTATVGTMVGNVLVSALPYTAVNTANQYNAATVYFGGLTGAVDSLVGLISANTAYVQMYKVVAGGAVSNTAVVAADIGATQLAISGCYVATN